jgi:hypothetical protein
MGQSEETSVKIKFWGIIILLAACIGWLFIVSSASGERITRVETTQKHVVEALVEIKSAMIAIKQDIADDVKDIKLDLRDHVKVTNKMNGATK